MNRKATELRIGGLARLSTCDWPGQLVATIFCQGCAWDCPYCHNPGLRSLQAEDLISWRSIVEFLQSRRSLLDGVVFSGGEPTLQSALLDAVTEVRKLGFRIGLHTAGIVPERLASLLPLLDWVGFDVKAPFAIYPRITGIEGSGDNALESLRSLLVSGIPHEIRTTVHPFLLSPTDLLELRDQLLYLGIENFVVQQFSPRGTLSGRLPSVSEYPIVPQNLGSDFLCFRVR